MSPILSMDKKNMVYIPVGAEKGDCPFCEGVLYRDSKSESDFRVPEAYTCDCCSSRFFESIYLYCVSPYSINKTPRRVFVSPPNDKDLYKSVYYAW